MCLLFYKSWGSQRCRLHTICWALRGKQLFSFHCAEVVIGLEQGSFRLKWNLLLYLGNLLPGIAGRDWYCCCQIGMGMQLVWSSVSWRCLEAFIWDVLLSSWSWPLPTASSVSWWGWGCKAKKGAFVEDRISCACDGCSIHTWILPSTCVTLCCRCWGRSWKSSICPGEQPPSCKYSFALWGLPTALSLPLCLWRVPLASSIPFLEAQQ